MILKKHLQLRWEITRESARRKEILELPEVALREAVINAVCHRDYNEQGAHVMVEIFDDRVEIYNPGGLPRGLSEKDFGKRSVCRNPAIASLLLRCNYIEKMGSGIERIRAALARENCPAAVIRYESIFTFEFSRPTYVELPEEKEPVMEDRGKTRVETRGETRVETRGEILGLIGKNPQITAPELAESLDISIKGVEWQISQLKKDGLLKRVGPTKGGRWVIVPAKQE